MSLSGWWTCLCWFLYATACIGHIVYLFLLTDYLLTFFNKWLTSVLYSSVEIYNEKSFLNGNTSLRLKCVPRANNAVSTTNDNNCSGTAASTNIYSIIRDIKDKTKTMTASMGLNHFTTLRNNGQPDDALTGLQISGDIVICWLFLRGLVLMELGKAWEAGLMYNLVDSLQMFATVSKFVVPAASYHMAELVLNFTVCERPIMVSVYEFVIVRFSTLLWRLYAAFFVLFLLNTTIGCHWVSSQSLFVSHSTFCAWQDVYCRILSQHSGTSAQDGAINKRLSSWVMYWVWFLREIK